MKKYLLGSFFALFCFPLTALNECGKEKFWHYPEFEKQANITDRSLYEAAAKDRIGFWEKCADELHWFSKWHTPYEWKMPFAKWYLGGKLNIAYNCLDKHLAERGDKLAFIWCNERGDEQRVTYRQMHEKVCRLANGLQELGIKKGDVVAIYMPMTPEGIASMLACARIGAVHSVIFAGTGAGSTQEKINDAKAKAILTADVTYRRGRAIPVRSTIDQIIDECPTVKHIIVHNRIETDLPKDTRYVDYTKLTKRAAPDCPAAAIDSEDRLFVLYTSGTTGKPKGILHTTGGYLVGVHNTFKWVFDPKPNDVFWCTADIGWITGHSYVVYGPMSNGITQLIYEGTFDYPDKGIAWQLIEKHGVNTFYTAPTVIRTFMKWGDEWVNKADTSSLRLLGSIGEPLNPEAWQWYNSVIGKERCPIVDTWFQTETGAFVMAPIPGLTPLKPGSVTTPLPGFEADIYTDANQHIDHGLLAITSPFPSMLRGVLNNNARYYNTYWAKWDGKAYYAGDDATVDSDGYFWVRGRADEVMKVSGHRIGTAEVENVLVAYPTVAEAAVIGLPDPIRGQKIAAFVVLKKGAKQDELLEHKLEEHVSYYMGKYAKPAHIVFVDELPKTRSGKILRRVIFNLLVGKPSGDLTTLVNPQIMGELEKTCIVLREQL